MLEKKIKTAFEEMTPTSEQKADMLRGIWAEYDRQAVQYRRRPARRVLVPVVAAALVLILGTTALATGSLGRYINWKGEEVGPIVTPKPTAQPEEETARKERTGSLLTEVDCGENELTAVRSADSATASTGMWKTVDSLEEMEAILAESPLQLPENIPEGYTLFEAHVSFACGAGYDYELVSSEEDLYGLTVERYQVPKEGLIVSGYSLDYHGEGGMLHVSGELREEGVDHVFGVDEEQTVRMVDVKGMDDAFVMQSGTGAALYMRTALTEPIAFTRPDYLFGAHPTEDGDRFGEIQYSIDATDLTSAQLMTLFG